MASSSVAEHLDHSDRSCPECEPYAARATGSSTAAGWAFGPSRLGPMPAPPAGRFVRQCFPRSPGLGRPCSVLDGRDRVDARCDVLSRRRARPWRGGARRSGGVAPRGRRPAPGGARGRRRRLRQLDGDRGWCRRDAPRPVALRARRGHRHPLVGHRRRRAVLRHHEADPQPSLRRRRRRRAAGRGRAPATTRRCCGPMLPSSPPSYDPATS